MPYLDVFTDDIPDPCGTGRLSPSIQQGVVDSKLRVHGVKNLRVLNASVMPVIPDCRIQNSVYMVGEKVSSIILGYFIKMTHLMG